MALKIKPPSPWSFQYPNPCHLMVWFLSKNLYRGQICHLEFIGSSTGRVFFFHQQLIWPTFTRIGIFKPFFYTGKLAEIFEKKANQCMVVAENHQCSIVWFWFIPKGGENHHQLQQVASQQRRGQWDVFCLLYISESWTKNSCVYTTLNEILVVFTIGINRHPYVMVYHNPHITGQENFIP